MKTMRVGLIAISLAFAGPTSAETVAPPSPSKKPASIPLDPELVRRLESATAGFVYHIVSGVKPGCERVVGVSEESILCHDVKSGSPAPTSEWTAELAALIRKGMHEKPGLFVFTPEVAIRLHSERAVTEVLISISQDMAEIHSSGMHSIRGSLEVPSPIYLPVLARAFQGNPEVLGLIERGPTRSRPPAISRARDSAIQGPFWPNCVPGAALGEFVDYDQPPQPIARPLPEYPPGLQKSERGRVLLHVFVDATGKVCFARVIQGNPPFEKYVLEAVRRWVFKPAMAGASPVGVWIELPFDT